MADKIMRTPIQLDLFSQPTLNVSKAIKAAMADDARDCGMSREQLVDRMNDIAERHGVCLTHGNSQRLTIDTLEKWLNVSDPRHIPLKALTVFCAAVGRWSVLDVVARSLGLMVIGDREQKMLAWAEAKIEVQRKSRQIRKIESEL